MGSTQLLILLSFVLVVALLLAVYVVFAVRNRTSKGKMKHGIQSKKKKKSPPADAPDDLNTDILSTPLPPLEPTPTKSEAKSILQKDPSFQQAANETEVSPMTKEPSSLDINARLGGEQGQTTPSQPQTSEPIELLRLLRDPQTGRLLVEVAGKRYAKLADVTDRKVGQYILELAAHLLTFTNGVIAKPDGIKAVYNPKVKQTPEPIVAPKPKSNELVPPPPPEAQAAFRAALEKQRGRSQPESSSPPPRRGGFFGRSQSSSSEPTLLPALNLAKEINKIVQARLYSSPLAATTDIDIISAPEGGIRIIVNNQTYSSPDDISDPQVKTLIKDSIKQWEKS